MVFRAAVGTIMNIFRQLKTIDDDDDDGNHGVTSQFLLKLHF